MLNIRKEQSEILKSRAMDSFKERLRLHLTKKFSDLEIIQDEDKLKELVETSVEKATGYGIQSKDDIRKFAEILVSIGLDFDSRKEFQWMQKILGDHRRSSYSKLSSIDNYLIVLEKK